MPKFNLPFKLWIKWEISWAGLNVDNLGEKLLEIFWINQQIELRNGRKNAQMN